MPFLKDYPAIEIIQDLARRQKCAVHLVGGFLRDYCLGISKTDFDFAVEKDALHFARLFSRRIKGAYVLLDAERGCARIVKKDAGKIWTFDFADYRAKTFREDLKERDFTINTLSVDIGKLKSTDELRDVIVDLKKGLKDLHAKSIRMVSSHAFKDDPLRVLRGFSLSATLGFKIEKDTLAKIRKSGDLLKAVSYERIRDELFKILESPRAALTLKAMDKAKVLDKVIPQLKVMYNSKQAGTYHHLDVWPHSLEVVVQLDGVIEQMSNNPDIVDYLNESLGGNRTRRALLRLSALLHDIGKPETRKEEKDRLTFYGHERVGKNITTHIAKMLKLSTGERHALEDMVLWHLRPGYLSNFQQPSEKSIYRYLRDTRREAVSILLLSLGDQRATRGPMSTLEHEKLHQRICLDVLKLYFDKKKEKPFVRLLDGHALMKSLRLKPSPLVGKILTEVTEKQVLGKIKTKKEALALAAEIAAKADKKKS